MAKPRLLRKVKIKIRLLRYLHKKENGWRCPRPDCESTAIRRIMSATFSQGGISRAAEKTHSFHPDHQLKTPRTNSTFQGGSKS
jgi:hypothetical protein